MGRLFRRGAGFCYVFSALLLICPDLLWHHALNLSRVLNAIRMTSAGFVPASSHFTNDKFATAEIGAAAGSPSFFIGSISSETSAPTTSNPAERKNGS